LYDGSLQSATTTDGASHACVP